MLNSKLVSKKMQFIKSYNFRRNEEERKQQFEATFRPNPLLRGLADPKADEEAIAGFWNAYQRYARHVELVDALVAQNSAIASKLTIGTSAEGRTIVAIRIGANSSPSKKIIWIEGGIHAREWISPATVTYFAQFLVNKYKANDATTVDVLNYFDIIIVPSLNGTNTTKDLKITLLTAIFLFSWRLRIHAHDLSTVA